MITCNILPGGEGEVDATTVPSAVACNNKKIWGFEALGGDTNKTETVDRYFKAWFPYKSTPSYSPSDSEENEQNQDSSPESAAEGEANKTTLRDKAKKCLKYYLNYLHVHIRKTLQLETIGARLEGKASLNRWNSTYIWFLFSFPGTWDRETINFFEDAIRKTTFGSTATHHLLIPPSLNQAQAAMLGCVPADMSRSNANPDVLVADIGTSTFDVAMFAMRRARRWSRHTIQDLLQPTAQYNGSALIDEHVLCNLVQDVQRRIHHPATSAFRNLSYWEKQKHALAEARRLITLEGYVKQKHALDHAPNTAIQFCITDTNGQTATILTTNITEPLLQTLTAQCDQVWEQIKQQLEAWRQLKSDRVGTIVLTGGLSSHKYVQRVLRERVNAFSSSIQIFVPREPELSVSKGLVWNALDTLRGKSRFRYVSKYNFNVVVGNIGEGIHLTKTILCEDEVVNAQDFKRKVRVEIPRKLDNNTDVRIV